MTDIFIAYSHEDLAYKNELKKFLGPLLREGRVKVWDDYDIEAGDDWDAAIKEQLYSAGIVLLLVSADSLASDYFYGKEVEVSLKRHRAGETIVVPVVLRACDWVNTPLGGLEALPEKGRPVKNWPVEDEAWQDVVSRLRRLLDEVEKRQKQISETQQRYRDYTAAINAAEQLARNQNWTEAKKAYDHALRGYQDGFQPDRATVQACQRDCEAQLQAEKKRKPEADSHAEAPEPDSQPERKARLVLMGLGGVLALVLLLWMAFGSRSGGSEPTSPDMPLLRLEVSAFEKALGAGTIPALEQYLKQYPGGSRASEARQQLSNLQKTFDEKVSTARVFESADEWSDALSLYREAQRLNPDDAGVAQKVQELKRK